MGKTYQEKRDEIRDQAINFSLNMNIITDFDYLQDCYSYFETMGKKYGLLKEFQENGIC